MLSPLLQGEAARPTLRVFSDQAPEPSTTDARGLSPRMTLREFYLLFFRPVCLVAHGAAKRNLDQYDQSIDYWVSFTGDPPLDQITDFKIAEFFTELHKLPGRKKTDDISPNTIRKHCTHLQAVLDRTGPKSREARFRKAQNLLADVPYLEKPPARIKEAEDNFTLEEIGKILRNCNAAIAPSYLEPPQRAAWWQHLFIFDYNTGLRIGSLQLVKWSSLRPDAKGQWWVYVKVKRGHERRISVNRHAYRAFDAMRPITGHLDFVWHWPHVHSWLQENRRRILEAAAIPPERRFGFHGIRKANSNETSEFDPLAAMLQLGHSDWSTTQNSYINPARAAAAMEKLPQPPSPKDEAQRRLF